MTPSPKIGILGASGFVGGRLLETLLLDEDADAQPRPRAIVPRFSSLARPARFDVEWRRADGLDTDALTEAFRDCEVIVQSVAGNPPVILGAARSAYEAAARAGVRRMVVLSSAVVHGQTPAPGTDENTPLPAQHELIYNEAKARADELMLVLRRAGNPVELVFLRPGIVFGPRSRWVTELAEQTLAGRACLVDGGRGICNTIYVDNLVHAIRLAAENPDPALDQQAFLVGDREEVTWADFYCPFVGALGRRMADVPTVPMPVHQPRWTERLDGLRASDAAQAMLAKVPGRWKNSVKAALRAWTEPPAPGGWSASARPAENGAAAPTVSREMAGLQATRWKLPHAKAEHMLGYQPPVTFAEGCRRSVAWLEFAGYPVVANVSG